GLPPQAGRPVALPWRHRFGDRYPFAAEAGPVTVRRREPGVLREPVHRRRHAVVARCCVYRRGTLQTAGGHPGTIRSVLTMHVPQGACSLLSGPSTSGPGHHGAEATASEDSYSWRGQVPVTGSVGVVPPSTSSMPPRACSVCSCAVATSR